MYFYVYVHTPIAYTKIPFFQMVSYSVTWLSFCFLNWASCLWLFSVASRDEFFIFNVFRKYKLFSEAVKYFFLCKHLLPEFKQKFFGFHCTERLNSLSCFFMYLKINGLHLQSCIRTYVPAISSLGPPSAMLLALISNDTESTETSGNWEWGGAFFFFLNNKFIYFYCLYKYISLFNYIQTYTYVSAVN